jgi:ParB family chromosome partitioning protein
MKRDLVFVAERLANLLDENRLAILARQNGIRQKRDDGGAAKTFAAFLRRADESTLGRVVVESVILLTASRGNASHVLRDAATAYKVDADSIAAKIKQEFAAKEKSKTTKKPKPPAKSQSKSNKKAAA